MKKIIIGLTGPIACGKGTVKKYLVEKYKANDCRFSTILRDMLNRIYVPINRKNLVDMSITLRKTFGEDALARVIAGDVGKIEDDIVVVDGVRRMADIKYLSRLPNFVLTAIDADPKIRYQRLIKRGENGDDNKKTYRQFIKDHEYETEKSIPQVMKRAEYFLDNNGTFDDLHSQVEDLLKKFRA